MMALQRDVNANLRHAAQAKIHIGGVICEALREFQVGFQICPGLSGCLLARNLSLWVKLSDATFGRCRSLEKSPLGWQDPRFMRNSLHFLFHYPYIAPIESLYNPF